MKTDHTYTELDNSGLTTSTQTGKRKQILTHCLQSLCVLDISKLLDLDLRFCKQLLRREIATRHSR